MIPVTHVSGLERLLSAAVVLVMMAACGGEGNDGPRGETTTSASPTTAAPPATNSCTAGADGYALDYPPDWFTNDRGNAEPCRYFHPEPFQVPTATEPIGIAIVLRFAEMGFERIVREVTSSPGAIVLDQERRAVGGMEAARVRTRATGEGLLPQGALAVTYYVDFRSRTMVASAVSTAQGVTLERSSDVLDSMMRSLRRVPGTDEAPCSAATLSPHTETQPGLPGAAASMRDRIVRAAVACDFDALEELALDGPSRFAYSFGDEGDPGGYWRRQESSRGPRSPLRYLVAVLNMPHRLVEHHQDRRYVWPSAFAYERWDDVPPAEKEALKPLYTEGDFESFARFGGYVGYRVGITPDGDWTFFVAGD